MMRLRSALGGGANRDKSPSAPARKRKSIEWNSSRASTSAYGSIDQREAGSGAATQLTVNEFQVRYARTAFQPCNASPLSTAARITRHDGSAARLPGNPRLLRRELVHQPDAGRTCRRSTGHQPLVGRVANIVRAAATGTLQLAPRKPPRAGQRGRKRLPALALPQYTPAARR